MSSAGLMKSGHQSEKPPPKNDSSTFSPHSSMLAPINRRSSLKPLVDMVYILFSWAHITQSCILFVLRTLKGRLFMRCHKLPHLNLRRSRKNLSSQRPTVCPNLLPLDSVSLHTDYTFFCLDLPLSDSCIKNIDRQLFHF